MTRFSRNWIRSPVRAIGLLGAVAVAVVLLASETYLVRQRVKALAHAAEEAISASRIIGEQKARALQSVHLVLDGVAERIGDLSRGLAINDFLVHVMLRTRIVGMPHIGALFVVNADGKVVSASNDFPVRQVSVADREYFQFHRGNMSSDIYIGPPLVSRMGGDWTVHVSRRIVARDGRFVGVVVAALNLEYFETLNDLKLDYITPISLFLSDGRLLTRTPRDETLLGHKFPLPSGVVGNADGTHIEHVAGENPGLVVYRNIDGFPVTLSVATPEYAALGEWRENALTVRVSAGAVSVFIMLISWLLIREVRREQALSASLADTGKTLQALVDTALDAIITVNDKQCIVLFNPAAEAMFACPAKAALGCPLSQFLRGGDTEEGVLCAVDNIHVGVRSDGVEFPVEASVSRLTSNGSILVTIVLRDISERLRAESVLNDTNAELSRLSKSLIEVRESERFRIARELHDELGQQLMRLRLDLSWLAGRLRESRPELDAKVTAMKDLIAETVASVRRITTELRPPLLDDLGLVAAVEWLLDDFEQRSGIMVNIEMDPSADRCNTETATAIYRISQEALTNVMRHAQANRVSVALRVVGDMLRLEIEDDGKGMSQSSNAAVRSGNGLVGIRERVLMLSGLLDVGTSLEGGLALRICLPLPPPVVPLDLSLSSASTSGSQPLEVEP